MFCAGALSITFINLKQEKINNIWKFPITTTNEISNFDFAPGHRLKYLKLFSRFNLACPFCYLEATINKWTIHLNSRLYKIYASLLPTFSCDFGDNTCRKILMLMKFITESIVISCHRVFINVKNCFFNSCLNS